MRKTFYIGALAIILEVAPKNTIWWDRVDYGDRPLQRIDNIVGLSRIYIPHIRKYVWRLCLGRVQFLVANQNQEGK